MDCIYLKDAKYLGNFRFLLQFNNDIIGEVNIKPIIEKYPQAKSLKQDKEIRKFYLDSWPTLAWPNGFDIAPEILYELLEKKQNF